MKVLSNLWLILLFFPIIIQYAQCESGDFKAIKFSGYACNGVRLEISCPNDYVIQITKVKFGRELNDRTCLSANQTNVTECETNSTTSLRHVQRMCDERETCSIRSDVSTFGVIGCTDSFPILSVDFHCVIKTYHGFSCENDGQLKIVCPANRLIITKSSFFGQKTTDHQCKTDSSNQISCLSANVNEYFRSTCDKRETCLLNSTLNTNCSSNSKGNYFEVSWGCLECKNNYGNDAQCEYWANLGDCKKNADWMSLYCRKACWKCDRSEDQVCKNVHPSDGECNYWASKNECEKNPAWMMPFCRKACLKCNKSENDCVDRNNMCSYWESIGECTKNPLFMKYNCKASCEKCSPSPPKCINAYGEDARCEFWANIGECYKNAPFMIPNCFKACSRCKPTNETEEICKDEFVSSSPTSSCPSWAKFGECIKNPTWMIPHCKKSCNWCKNEPIRIDVLGEEPTPGNVKLQTGSNTIILNKAFEKDVRIQYFLAFFQNSNLIKVQLWRPINGSYELIYEKIVEPKGKNYIQTIVVEKCLTAKKGDRLGFTPDKTGDSPLGVRFNIAEASSQTSIQKDNGSFDEINLPYSFSLSAVLNEDKC